MTEWQSDTTNGRSTDRLRSRWERREFLAIGGGVGATLFAGCTSGSQPGGDPDDGSEDGPEDDSPGESNFRLLVSDRPADIGDFESLAVTFDSARVFQSGGEGDVEDEAEEEGSDEKADESGDADRAEAEDEPGEQTEDGSEDGTADDETEDEDEAGGDENEDDDDASGGGEQDGESDDGDDGDDGDDDADEGQESRGFAVFDLDEPTADLTEVVGEKAIAVTEGELNEGSYRKLELLVSDVEGIVDGEEAEVKVPSEKLQLTKPFEIREGETVDFVFDINVVKRGNEESYNLKPVVSKSGVVGEDLDEHEEVGAEDDENEEESGGDQENGDGPDENDDGAHTDGEETETESDRDDGDAETDDE